jgi:NADPH:quinone reductase-like Zn-dependent oxidoreductase
MMKTLPNVIAKRPVIPEHDLAGVIADANGSEFSAGDEVIGFIPLGDCHLCSHMHTMVHANACC